MTAPHTSPTAPRPAVRLLAIVATAAIGAGALLGAWTQLDDGGPRTSGRTNAFLVAVVAGVAAGALVGVLAGRRRAPAAPARQTPAWFVAACAGAGVVLSRFGGVWVAYLMGAVGGMLLAFAVGAAVLARRDR